MQQTVRFGPQAEQVQGTGCERQGVGAQGRWASGGRRLGDTWRLGGEHRQVRQRTTKRRFVFGFFFQRGQRRQYRWRSARPIPHGLLI